MTTDIRIETIEGEYITAMHLGFSPWPGCEINTRRVIDGILIERYFTVVSARFGPDHHSSGTLIVEEITE